MIIDMYDYLWDDTFDGRRIDLAYRKKDPPKQ